MWKKCKTAAAATLAVLIGMPLTERAMAETLRFVILPTFRFGEQISDAGSDGS